MKRVIILGGGPVGLTLANELSKKFITTVIVPKESFSFKSLENSNFILNPNSSSGVLFGNSRRWGSQHEGLSYRFQSSPLYSDLPGFPFDINELIKYEPELLRQGWPKLSKQNLGNLENLIGMHPTQFWKGKSFETLPKFLSKNISIISKDFENIEFRINENSILEEISIDQTSFIADIFVFATGGLSNVAFLSDLISKSCIQPTDSWNMLGRGYTNHPKGTFLKVKFRHPKYFGGKFNFHQYKPLKNWDLQNDPSHSRHLRVSSRLWPIYNDATRLSVLTSRALGAFGFFTQALLVVYLELPQVSSNYIKYVGKNGKSLNFHFHYSFPESLESYFYEQLEKIAQNFAQNPNVAAVEKEKIDFQSLILTDANHHFGGTRMATSEQNGVVNSFSRSFGVSNMFIVGTSTLPVSSFLHPTLLSAALALRAAEEISKNE